MTTFRTVTAAVLTAGALATPATVLTATAHAETHDFPAKVAINGRAHIGDDANAPGSKVDAYKAGQPVPVTCQQDHGGALWDHTADDFWVPDEYVKTGTDGRAPGVPACNDGAPAPSPSQGAQKPVDDFDHKDRGFGHDQCTAFAAFRIATRLGVHDFTNHWHGRHFGDAGTWDDAARGASGVTVDTTPKVGAIVVNDVHKVGHVAYVNAVHPDGSFDVEEYNWNNPEAYGTRQHVHISGAQADFQHVLHFG